MVDLHGQYLKIKDEIDKNIQSVINSSQFINGDFVQEFANDLAKYLNVKYVIPCANGTDAIQISLMALGLKAGDEVIIPVHTYVATAEVIALLQLKAVFIDVDYETFNIDIKQIESLITAKTKAIVPVHLYGQCADMESILHIAKKHSLYVIEDTAQAIGADYTFTDSTKKKAGTIGHLGTTSFFPSKNLGCYGDGGAIFTNDDELAKKCKMITNHGQEKKYYHDVVGCNSRLDTIQAAILKAKLPRLDQYTKARNDVAERYDEAFKNFDGIEIPKRSKNSTHAFHQYTLKITGCDRDKLKESLQEKGIPSMIYYPVPLHKQKAYREYSYGNYNISNKLSNIVLSLPIHTEMEATVQDKIIDSFKESYISHYQNKLWRTKN